MEINEVPELLGVGIIGYGMVGRAVDYGLQHAIKIISDPAVEEYKNRTTVDVCGANPDAIFVCVPTDTDDFGLLIDVLDTIDDCEYTGLVVVKSTALPHVFKDRPNVVYWPEFLSRATSYLDFIKPPMVLIGGKRADDLVALLGKTCIIETPHVVITDINTACLAKYAMNSFYALKLTYMNSLYDVANKLKVDWPNLVDIFKKQPWMGTHHFDVPGPDGYRGFGGPCLPKDTEAFADAYNIELLKTVLNLNEMYRDEPDPTIENTDKYDINGK